MHAAARNVDRNSHVVGGDLGRVLGTAGVSVSVFAKIITHPDELRRLMELVETHDFPGLVSALQHGARFPDDFFPQWIRRAGGYFPKFAQVLSVRADLIRSREVLEQLGRCLEDMPPRSEQQVRDHLLAQNWDTNVCAGVGAVLNAGTVAQVNGLSLPEGRPAVVKVSWPDTKRQMQTDFRLFRHALDILRALRLEDEKARSRCVVCCCQQA
jgi:predicted unusual protein kinase regulating ubiquinone biosynthesis (AarF/ABC1/UbiB family)